MRYLNGLLCGVMVLGLLVLVGIEVSGEKVGDIGEPGRVRKVVNVEREGVGDESPLTVEFGVVRHETLREVRVHNSLGARGGYRSHLNVILRNRSKKAVRIYSDLEMRGYRSLSFEVIDDAGKKHVIRKGDRSWPLALPKPITIPAGRSHVIDVYFDPVVGETKRYGWNMASVLKTVDRKKRKAWVKIRPVFHIKATNRTRELKLWTGTIKGAFERYKLYVPRDRARKGAA